MKKNIISIFVAIIVFLLTSNIASAHVVVKPAEVGVAQRVNFVVSVPTEKDNPTVGVRLVIPEQLKSVRPNVKPGWNIQLIKTGEGDEERISEVIWTGGSIPAEQRDEFMFSSQAPAEETTLNWKAYQTYSDGDIVAWDKDPEVVAEYEKNNPPKEGEEEDHNAPSPYSSTKVVDDLASSQTETTKDQAVTKGSFNSDSLSMVAILLAAVSLGLQFWRRK